MSSPWGCEKQIPFGNDRKKGKGAAATGNLSASMPRAFVFAFAFLSVIPEGNLLLVSENDREPSYFLEGVPVFSAA